MLRHSRLRRRRRTRLAQDKYRQQTHCYPHADHGVEQTLPRVFQHDQVAEHRRQHGDDAGNAVEQRQHFGPSTVVQRIAQNSESHHVAAAGADPLDKASGKEVAAGVRLRAEQGGDNKDRRPHHGDRFTPRAVGDTASKQHRRGHSGQIDREGDM